MPSFKPKPLPPLEELNRLFEYSIVTGELRRKISVSSRGQAGTVIDKIDVHGYIKVGYQGTYYKVHRIIFKMVEGRDPDPLCIVDHKNNVKHHNAWHNLREATDSQQAMNISSKSRNTSGYRGVFVVKNAFGPGIDGYRAAIGIDRKWKYLGTFRTPEEAYAVYCRANTELHGEFSRLHL